MMRAIACGLFMAVAACGTDGTGNNPDGGGSNNSDGGGGNMDAFVPDPGYTKLISRTWNVPPGSADTYKCVRLTLTEDTWLTNIMAQAPLGTHHTVLSIASGGAAGPDGEQDCGVGTLGMVMLFASGVGTSPLDFPTDVGVKIPAGSQIHLNLHLFNASDDPLSGESGIWVKQQSTKPPLEAEMVFAGTTSIFLQPSAQPQTVNGGCTVTNPYTLFAVWPHMHQIATHQKVELTRGGTTTVLHDMPFHFEEQNYYKKAPMVEVQTGDHILVTCTYLNDTGSFVTIGDGSNQEMCFSGLYRYPAQRAGLFSCSEGPGI